MTKMLLLDIIKSGSLAYLFSKVTKSIGQKEISEIIGASGWAVVGIDVVALLIPVIKVIADTIDKTTEFFQGITTFLESVERFVGK